MVFSRLRFSGMVKIPIRFFLCGSSVFPWRARSRARTRFRRARRDGARFRRSRSRARTCFRRARRRTGDCFRVLGFCFRFGCRRGCRRVVLERAANYRAQARVVLAASHQVTQSENHREDYDEQHKQADQMPALQDKIAAAFFFFCCHSTPAGSPLHVTDTA